MAAISHLFTLARVAQMLGENEDWLSDISIEMDPEDGIIPVYGLGDDYTPTFTGKPSADHRNTQGKRSAPCR